MTPREMYDKCLEAEAHNEERRKEGHNLGEAFLVLMVPRKRPPSGVRARLFEADGPLGEILSYRDGFLTGRWTTRKLKKYLMRHFGEDIECQ